MVPSLDALAYPVQHTFCALVAFHDILLVWLVALLYQLILQFFVVTSGIISSGSCCSSAVSFRGHW